MITTYSTILLNKMWDLLNNREISVLIWGAIALILLLSKTSTRSSIYDMLKIFFSKHLMTLYLWMGVYLVPIIYLLWMVGLWNNTQIKNTIIWILFAALPTVFNANKVNENKNYFKDALKDIFRFTIFVEFFINLYPFSFITELILLPFIVLFIGMLTVSKGSEKHLAVTKILNFILSLLGLFLVGFAVYKLIGDFPKFATTGTLTDFLIPPLLTLIFLPFVYLVAVYMAYETNFITLKYKIPNPYLRRFAKYQAVLNFGFQTKNMKRWIDILSKRERNTKEAILSSVKEVKTMKAIERDPPIIPAHLGWSPYVAKDFLLNDGIETGYYQCVYENEWAAGSKYINLKDANNITYYVTGDDLKATILEINLNVSTPKVKTDAHAKLLTYTQKLFEKAFGKDMPHEIVQAISHGRKKIAFEGGKKITVSRQEWMNDINKGYSMKFSIEMNTKDYHL